jgi:hypothetical protein
MIFLLVWGAVGFLMGIVLVTVIPWTAAAVAGRDWIEGVSDRYIWLAQSAARRSALIVRDGDVKLVPKRYDSDLKADKDTSTGDPRHHRDTFDVVSRLKNKILGIGLTSRDTYVSPLLAELGGEAKQAQERQEIGVEESGSQKQPDKMVDGIHIPKRPQLVDLRQARHLTTGSSEPEDGHESYIKTKISQEKFHEKVSFGQGILLIIGALGSMGLAWYGASSGDGGTGAPAANTTVSFLTLLAAGAGGGDGDDGGDWLSKIKETLVDTKEYIVGGLSSIWQGFLSLPWYKILASVYILLSLVIIPVLALVTYGPIHMLISTGLMIAVAVGIPGFIVLMGPSLPTFLGIPIARGFWILAQLTVGKGVLVERDSGELEHRMLVDAPAGADHDFETVLSDGKTIHIDGSKGDLFRFAWGPMGAVAEKTQDNMGTITEDIPPAAATDGGEVMTSGLRQGLQPAIRVPDNDDDFLVTLPQLATLCERTAESQGIRQGRQKALTEHGGQQQISTVVFMGMLLGSIVIGGLFGLIAGGAII